MSFHFFATSYFAVNLSAGNRCMLSLTAMKLPVTITQAYQIMLDLNYKPRTIDVVSVVRSRIGQSRHQRGAIMGQAPEVIDCSLLVQWSYRQVGIVLPRYAVNMRSVAVEIPSSSRDDLGQLKAGDLMFRAGWRPYYRDDPSDGVGHVGIATGEGTVVHAPNKRVGVIEESVTAFIGDGNKFRGVGRIIPAESGYSVWDAPQDRTIEWSEDVRCQILQRL